MNSGKGMLAGKFLLAAAIVSYPLAVYFLLDSVGPGALGLLLVVLLLIRFRPTVRAIPEMGYLAVPGLVAALAIAFAGNGTLALKFYPTLISLAMLASFGYTLIRPPSMIERIARATDQEFSEHAIPYTRAVTLVWCVFFAANALISATISVSGSLRSWTLYNGLIAYCLVVTMLVGELLIRRVYKRRMQLLDNPQ